MKQNLLALVLVGLASVVAAGGGAYLALREGAASGPRVSTQDTLSDQALSMRPGSTETSAAPSASGRGQGVVTESEGVIGPTPGAEAVAPETRAPAKRSSSIRSKDREVVTKPAKATPAAPAQRTSRPADWSTTVASAPDPEPMAQVPPRAERSREAPAVTPRDAGPRAAGGVPVEAPVVLPQAPVQAPVADPVIAAPPLPESIEVTVPADSVIGLQIEAAVTSDKARVEDRVNARVTRDVRVDGAVAIPAGSRMLGSVTQVDRGGKMRERARLGIRFHTLVLADGARVPVLTETIFREGESPTGESAAKIGGGAVGGAILGAILGGGKGAAIGGSIGAASGTAAVLAGGRNAATLAAGSTVTVRLQSPTTVTVPDRD